MASLLIRAGSRQLVFQILDPEFTVGRDQGNALRLPRDGVLPVHLRFRRVGERYRVAPAVPGAALRVNGRAVPDRLLVHGDRIDLGDAALGFWEDGRPRPVLAAVEEAAPGGASPPGLGLRIEPIASARPARPAAGARGGGRAKSATPPPPRRRRGMPPWMVWWNAALVALVVGFLGYRRFATGPVEPGSRDLIQLAETQRRGGDLEGALATLGLALQRGPDEADRTRIGELRTRLRRELQLREDSGPLARALPEVERIRSFVAAHLSPDRAARPAARELLRLTGGWLDEYREVCLRHENERELVAEIEGLAARFRGLAAPGEPAAAEDVLFAAGRQARMQPRRFPAAIGILEDWLAAAGAEAAGRAEVEGQLRAYREQGAAHAAAELGRIRRLIARGARELAIRDLDDLIRKGALPEWLEDAPELLRGLQQQR
jgi:hypothetical protein